MSKLRHRLWGVVARARETGKAVEEELQRGLMVRAAPDGQRLALWRADVEPSATEVRLCAEALEWQNAPEWQDRRGKPRAALLSAPHPADALTEDEVFAQQQHRDALAVLTPLPWEDAPTPAPPPEAAPACGSCQHWTPDAGLLGWCGLGWWEHDGRMTTSQKVNDTWREVPITHYHGDLAEPLTHRDSPCAVRRLTGAAWAPRKDEA